MVNLLRPMLRPMLSSKTANSVRPPTEGRCGAGYDEKSPERLNSRNGYRERTWDTRAGSVELKIPKLRQGSYRLPRSCGPCMGRADSGSR